MVQATLYRESYSECIAAIYHNNDINVQLSTKLEQVQVVYDITTQTIGGNGSGASRSNCFNLARFKADGLLTSVNHLTVLQSEDPGWFLARAFMFTSRTSHSFLRVAASSATDSFPAMASMLSGKTLSKFTQPLATNTEEVEGLLHKKWETVCKTEIITCIRPGIFRIIPQFE